MGTTPVSETAGAGPKGAVAAGLTLLGFAAFGATVGAIGPVAFVQRLGMLPLAVAAMVSLLVAFRPGPVALLRRPALPILLAACAWILITLAWSPRVLPDRAAAIVATLAVCGLALAAAAPLPEPHARRVRAVFLASMGVLAAVLVFEAATWGAASAFIRGVDSVGKSVWPRGSAVLVVMVWIALALLFETRRYALMAVLAVAAGVAIWGGTMRSAQLASIVGLVAFAAAAAAPRLVVSVVAGFFGLYALAAPWISLHLLTADAGYRLISSLPLSAYHRLAIWEHASKRIVDAPLFGYGFGTARWISDQHATMVIAADSRAHLDVMPLHTHNAWIQIWLETGLVGLACALAIVAVLALGARRRYATRPPLMAVAGAAAAGMTVASLSFGIWQEWWLATLTLSAMLVLTLFPGVQRLSRSR